MRPSQHPGNIHIMTQPLADIGLIGLAVMGENLALNMESRGFRVAVYNRTAARVDEFIAGRAKGKNFSGAHTPAGIRRRAASGRARS